MVNMSAMPIPVGDNLYIYYGGARHHHDWWIVGEKEGLNVPEATSMEHVEYALGLATLRLNGFVSIDAGPVREGILITRALRTESPNLLINASCGKSGYIRVEATDADDQVFPGFSRDSFDVFQGDSTSHKLSCAAIAKSPHSGALRLRFFMRNASLYSITFA